jgi:hypothetical protein
VISRKRIVPLIASFTLVVGFSFTSSYQKSTAKTPEQPQFTFVSLSDIHVGSYDHIMATTAEKRLVGALDYFKKNKINYEALVIDGDFADDPAYDPTELQSGIDALYSNIDPDALPIINTGNHDDKIDTGDAFFQAIGIKGDPRYNISPNNPADPNEKRMIYYDTWANGYHFVVFDNNRKDLSPDRLKWLKDKVLEGPDGTPNGADKTKPVFIVNHYDWTTWKTRNSRTIQSLQPFFTDNPQAVMITGHSHLIPGNNHNVVSKELGLLTVHDGVVYDNQIPDDVNYYENDHYVAKDISTGIYFEVFSDHFVVHEVAFNDGGYELGQIKVPFNTDGKPTDAVVTTTDKPTFPAHKTVHANITSGNNCLVRFPIATTTIPDGSRAINHYDIFATKDDGVPKLMDRVYNPYWSKVMPTNLSRNLKGLDPDTSYTITVKAIDVYGNVSDPLQSNRFTTPKTNIVDYATAPNVLKVDFTDTYTKKGYQWATDKSINKNDVLFNSSLETATVTYDPKFKKDVLVLTGEGHRGAPSSEARVSVNSSIFNNQQLSIETAFSIDSDIHPWTLPGTTKGDKVHDNGKEAHIISTYENGGYALYYNYTDKKLHFSMYGAKADDYEGLAAPISLDVPHHVAITFDQNQVKMFLDGQIVASEMARYSDGSPIGLLMNPTMDLFIGADSEGFQDRYNFFKGKVSYVNIFDRGISDAEVASDYQNFVASLNGITPAVDQQ